jgi:DNA-binding MarR family transcriptional regulator
MARTGYAGRQQRAYLRARGRYFGEGNNLLRITKLSNVVLMSRRPPPGRKPGRTSGRTSAASAEATELFLALGAVVKRLRRNPLPDNEGLSAAMLGKSPAPRHIAALVQVATDGPIGMSELAERLSVSLATVSQVVTDLADWGLVERSTDPTDRRRTFVTVAPAHQITIRALLESRLRPLERALRRLEADERAAFLRGLTVLAEELDHTKETVR